MRVIVAVLVPLLLGTAGGPTTTSGQTPKPSFEVASVRKNVSGSPSYGASLEFRPGRVYRATNVAIRMLLLRVYGLRDEQLVGGPAWVRTSIAGDRFDISARAARDVSRDEMILMIQALLEDRFRLRMIQETRQQDVYVLRRVRDDERLGPNLYSRSEDECEEVFERRAAGLPILKLPKPAGGLNPKMGTVCVPIGEVAAALGRELRTDVIDQTGLRGLWDYILAFSSQRFTADGVAPDPNMGPPFEMAVQEQLGFKLEKQRGTVPVFIIKSIEQPTAD